jgi:hypothetical protein
MHSDGIAIPIQLVCFAIFEKPFIRADPSMRQPNCIAPAIVPTISNIQAGRPKQITSGYDCCHQQ